MKNRSDIKTILGLTQNEMGMLLGMPKSTWSMFKSGQRDIPLAAKEQLAYYMDTAHKRKKHSKEVELLNKEQLKEIKHKLKQDLKNTEVKIKQVSKEIATAERIRKELIAALETATLLSVDEKNKNAKLLAKTIQARANNGLKKYNLASLNALEIKKETLEMLKLKIEEKIKL